MGWVEALFTFKVRFISHLFSKGSRQFIYSGSPYIPKSPSARQGRREDLSRVPQGLSISKGNLNLALPGASPAPSHSTTLSNMKVPLRLSSRELLKLLTAPLKYSSYIRKGYMTACLEVLLLYCFPWDVCCAAEHVWKTERSWVQEIQRGVCACVHVCLGTVPLLEHSDQKAGLTLDRSPEAARELCWNKMLQMHF